MDKIVSNYASALVSLAIDENKITEYKKYSEDILELLNGNFELVVLLSSPNVTLAEKFEIIEKIFADTFPEIMVSFIKYVVQEKRTTKLVEMFSAIIGLINKELKIVNGQIISALKLESDEISKIEKAICQKLNKNVTLENIVDSSIIGGIKVIVDNEVLDGSTKTQFVKLKNILLEESGD